MKIEHVTKRLAVLALGGAGLLLWVRRTPEPSTAPGAVNQLVGKMVPTLRLQAADSQWRDVLSGDSSTYHLLLLATASDCVTCADLAGEVRVLRGQFERLEVHLVAIGDLPDGVLAYARRERIERHFLADSASRLSKILSRGTPTPAALLLNGKGRVLWVDAREAAAHRRFPVSEVLRSVSGLGATHSGAADITLSSRRLQ